MSAKPARDRFAAALLLTAFLALAILLGACTFPSEGCRPEELVAPTNLSPAGDVVVGSLSPTLTWSYDGDCEPESFRVSLSSDLEAPIIRTTGEVGGDTTYWVPPTPLRPAMGYGWRVWAVSGSAEGPRGGGTLGGGQFRTGPVCESSNPTDYAAPGLMSPANGEAVELAYLVLGDGTRVPSVAFHFVWDDPTSCLPSEGYHVQVATSRDFAADASIDEFDTTHQRAMFFFAPGEEWEECSAYYWRVTTVLPGSTDGPTSATWSFVTPNASGGACMEVLPAVAEVARPAAGSSAIAGHVWHDLCAVPYASTDIAPPGCIFLPDGGLEANGILDPGEGGIGGVTVHLGSGPCPVVDGQTDMTDASGYYSFSLLSAGTYCVSIDAADDDNIAVLIPGSWTSPYRWYGPGPIEIELSLGEADIQRFNDFGFDYQFLPAPEPPTPTSAPPMATFLTNANCRRGPGTVYDVVTSLQQGQSVPIDGRNTQATWWRALPQGLLTGCWVSASTVEVMGDVSAVPLIAAGPTPTPEQGCWVQACGQCPLVCTLPCPPNATPGGACTP